MELPRQEPPRADMNSSRGKPGTAAVAAAPTGTQAVDRAAQLLIQVVHAPGALTFTELTAATGLAKSTTSRLLMALERHGLVQRDGRGRFRPGQQADPGPHSRRRRPVRR